MDLHLLLRPDVPLNAAPLIYHMWARAVQDFLCLAIWTLDGTVKLHLNEQYIIENKINEMDILWTQNMET